MARSRLAASLVVVLLLATQQLEVSALSKGFINSRINSPTGEFLLAEQGSTIVDQTVAGAVSAKLANACISGIVATVPTFICSKNDETFGLSVQCQKDYILNEKNCVQCPKGMTFDGKDCVLECPTPLVNGKCFVGKSEIPLAKEAPLVASINTTCPRGTKWLFRNGSGACRYSCSSNGKVRCPGQRGICAASLDGCKAASLVNYITEGPKNAQNLKFLSKFRLSKGTMIPNTAKTLATGMASLIVGEAAELTVTHAAQSFDKQTEKGVARRSLAVDIALKLLNNTIARDVLDGYCQIVFDDSYAELVDGAKFRNGTIKIGAADNLKGFDVFNIQAPSTKCVEVNNRDSMIACANSWLQASAGIDSTGLFVISSTAKRGAVCSIRKRRTMRTNALLAEIEDVDDEQLDELDLME